MKRSSDNLQLICPGMGNMISQEIKMPTVSLALEPMILSDNVGLTTGRVSYMILR